MTTQKFSTNLGLGVLPEFSQTQDPAIFADSVRVRNALRVLQGTLDVRTGYTGPDLTSMTGADSSYVTQQNYSRIYVKTSQDFLPGEMARFYNSAGIITADRAYANGAGFSAKALATHAIASGAYGEFLLEGMYYGYTGLTPGATYYLADTSGGFPRAGRIDTVTGTVTRIVGFAVTSTSLYFRPNLAF